MSGSECAECRRLGMDFAARTQAHFKLEGEITIAKVSQDADTTERLAKEIVRSARGLADIQDRIRSHNAAAHGR